MAAIVRHARGLSAAFQGMADFGELIPGQLYYTIDDMRLHMAVDGYSYTTFEPGGGGAGAGGPDTSAWPVLVVARDAATEGDPSSYGRILDASQPLGFVTIPLSNAPTVDSHGAFNTSTYHYTIPQTGTYEVTGKVRPYDPCVKNMCFGIGVDIANQDSAGFVWNQFPGDAVRNNTRFVGFNRRLMSLNAGEQLRLFTYFDVDQPQGINKAELTALRVR